MRRRMRRRIGRMPIIDGFKPDGIRTSGEVILTLDELEALRLADIEGLYQEEAARRMGISRQTFGRIIKEARFKVAEALVNAKSIRIEGGEVEVEQSPELRGRGWRRSFHRRGR